MTTPTTKEGRIMDFKDLTPELRERVRNAKSPDDLLKLAKEEGYELSDAELENISGGAMWGDVCVGVACHVCRGYRGCKVY